MVRKSSRTQTKIVRYKESDSEDDISEDEVSQVSDFEEENVSKKRKLPTSKTNRSKRQKQNKQTKSIKELEDELDENYLYQALSSPETNIQDLALDWLESFEEDSQSDKHESITLLINMILRSCGSLQLFQPHDLSNLDSCDDTVGEITIAFGEQTSHKFPYKSIPTFRKSVLQFFTDVIELSHEKGLLYTESDQDLSSKLMSYVITWIGCLTTTSIRSLRYTSTDILLNIQIELCRIIKIIKSSLDKTETQIGKLKSTTTARYKSLNDNLTNYTRQRECILEYLTEISKTVVDSRYKDIDPSIRIMCLKYLSESMLTYPDFFCQGIYLRYFGWLLTDSTNQVRNENTKVLLKLYKQLKEMPLGLVQFTEKYKNQFIKMSLVDSDLQVKINCFGILCELVKPGFLEINEIERVVEEYPFEKNVKLQAECSRFIELYIDEQADSTEEKYQSILSEYKCDQDLTFLIQTKSLINLCKSIENKPLWELFVPLAPNYESKWELLLKYFTLDVSSLRFEKDEESVDNEEIDQFKSFIELQLIDKIILLKFINGYFKYILGNKKLSQEIMTNQLIKLIEYLPKIESECLKDDQLFLIFLNLWSDLTIYKKDSIFNLFNKLDKIDQYEQITKDLFKYYKEMNVTIEFKEYFMKLFEPSNNVLTSDCKYYIETILQELVEELNRSILEESIGDIDEINQQKNIIEKIIFNTPTVIKLKQIGDFINISNLTNIADLIDNLTYKVIKKIDINLILSHWKHNFLQNIDSFEKSILNVFDFVIVILSWKFEKLMEIPRNEQRMIGIDIQFDGYTDMVTQLIRSIFESKDVSVLNLKTIFILKYIEIVSSFKFFYIKFENDNEFENFRSFFQQNIQLVMIKRDLQFEILELFLIKENQLGHELKVELDRNDEEGVNYDEYLEVREEEPSTDERDVSLFDDDEEDDEGAETSSQKRDLITQSQMQIKENKQKDTIWRYEKELSLLSLKIISLYNLSLVQDDIWSRIELNSEKLGDVFQQIIQQQQQHLKDIKDNSPQGLDVSIGERVNENVRENNDREDNATEETEIAKVSGNNDVLKRFVTDEAEVSDTNDNENSNESHEPINSIE